MPGREGPARAAKHGAAAGLSVFSILGLFGKRTLLVLGGKKALLGVFSIVSFKKFLFLPAWIWMLFATGGLSVTWWSARRNAPVTGRQQTILMSEDMDHALGRKSLLALQQGGLRTLPDTAPAVVRVRRVGERLKHALALLDPHPDAIQWLGLGWQFNVSAAQKDGMLAFALQPGQVVVSEHLLSLVASDDQLAFVLAHEMAHLVARHAAELLSGKAFWIAVLEYLSVVGIETWGHTVSLLTELPHDRQLEYEADQIATVLLSKACYNVDAGIEVLHMLKSHPQHYKGEATWLEHWSTHPSMDARVAGIRSHLPSILRASPCHYERDFIAALRGAQAAAAR